jgi:hypothetical protein
VPQKQSLVAQTRYLQQAKQVAEAMESMLPARKALLQSCN